MNQIDNINLNENGNGNENENLNQNVNAHINENGNENVNQEVDVNERGSEEPEYYCEVSIKGDKKFFKYRVGNDRFKRKYTKNSGMSCFKCHKQGCSSVIYETWEEDEPEITFGPTMHSINGVEHPPEVGKRYTELAKRKIKGALLNPELMFKPVNQIHEDVVNGIVGSLNSRIEREEFLAQMSKFDNVKRGEYKVRHRVLPPSPATNRDIDLTTRFVIFIVINVITIVIDFLHFNIIPIGRFTLDPVSGVQTALWDDQGDQDDDHSILLSHPDILQRLPLVNRIGIDGTFKSCPEKYYQVLYHHHKTNITKKSLAPPL